MLVSEEIVGGRILVSAVSLYSAKACVDWRESDKVCVRRLADWFSADSCALVDTLQSQLVYFRRMQEMMLNTRFADTLRQVLSDWMDELLLGDYTESYVEHRILTVQRLTGLDLALADIILLGDLVRRELLALARRYLRDDAVDMPAMQEAVDKAVSLDLMVVCDIYQQMHDEKMENLFLDRFLSVTGFSRSLYENLSVVQQLGSPGP
jgi:protoglobin